MRCCVVLGEPEEVVSGLLPTEIKRCKTSFQTRRHTAAAGFRVCCPISTVQQGAERLSHTADWAEAKRAWQKSRPASE